MTISALGKPNTMQSQKTFLTLRDHLQKTIVGQQALLDRLLIALLTGGHILLEGPPGLAKTKAVSTLADGVHASFQRIQFTPDLMPGDLTGSDIYDPNKGEFNFAKGPIFHEIILADEINRAPPKVQSALLEAMQEHQVTVGGVTRPLPDLFIVLATQNPLEQSGTYPLPEAQLDRFLLHIVLDYPNANDELQILQKDRAQHIDTDKSKNDTKLDSKLVLQARREVAEIHVDEILEKYIVALVGASRDLNAINTDTNQNWSEFLIAGASPRASIALLRASSAFAYLQGRDYVIPDDIIAMAPDVLRHRLILNHAARAAGFDADKIIQKIINATPVP